MSAWVGRVKAMSHRLEDVRVEVSDEDTILVLTMGLNKSYDSFIISLDTTPADQLTLEHVILWMLNEEVHCDNVEIQGVAVKARDKNKVKVKKEENVALAVTQSGGSVCWRCRKAGHIKAFCTAKPICGKAVEQANVALAAI